MSAGLRFQIVISVVRNEIRVKNKILQKTASPAWSHGEGAVLERLGRSWNGLAVACFCPRFVFSWYNQNAYQQKQCDNARRKNPKRSIRDLIVRDVALHPVFLPFFTRASLI